jgi:lipopolysaccharide biosynthesis glycosyltransferase
VDGSEDLMTVRRLCELTGLEFNPPMQGPEASVADVSIAFALDEGYLEPFKVALVSLAQSGNFLDAPIIVYSDSEEVAADPIVRDAVDRVVVLSGPKRDVLHDLARNSVQERGRSSWNRGTFLKWAVFESHETRRVVFLDADMAFAKRFDTALLAAATADFCYVPQFRENFVRQSGEEIAPDDVRVERMLAAIREDFPPKMSGRVNSGLLVLDRAVLDDAFFREVTGFARGKRQINEQSHFSEFIAGQPALAKPLSARFNFQEHYTRRLSWDGTQTLFRQVEVLHYTGHPKPWVSVPRGLGYRPGVALWHWYRSMAAPVLTYGR